MDPHISVVIPAFNEEKKIERCLASLARQSLQQSFEVIVVDNASEDGTREAALRWSAHLNLTVIHEPKKGRGAARAAGCKTARGEIICCTDADTIVPHNWLGAFSAAFAKDERIVGATGLSVIEDCKPVTNFIFNKGILHLTRAFHLVTRKYWMNGFSLAVRRSAYHQVGGFNTLSDANEDTELAFKLAKVGKITLIHSPRVIMSGRRFRKGLFRAWLLYSRLYVQKFILKRENLTLSVVEEEPIDSTQ